MALLSVLALALFETALSDSHMKSDGGNMDKLRPRPAREQWITADWSRLAANETNETEIIMVLPTSTPTVTPTPVPTAAPTKPTSKFTMTTEIASATESMPTQATLQSAIETAMPGVDPAEVETVVSFKVKQTMGISGVTPETFTEEIAKPSFATAYSVSEETIALEIVFSRRMDAHETAASSSSGGATVTVVIATTDATTADNAKTQASNADQVGTSFKAAYEAKALQAGQTIVLPTITPEAPNLEMDIEYNVRSSSAAVIVPPTAAEFATELTAAGGATLTFTVETPAPTKAPTAMPTGMPTKVPTPLAAGKTHAPTSSPTDAPTAEPTTAGPTAMPTTTSSTTTTTEAAAATTAVATTAAATTAAATPAATPTPAAGPAADSTTTSTAEPKTAPTESAAFSITLSSVASVCVTMALTATTVY
jgi:hypothetical protein